MQSSVYDGSRIERRLDSDETLPHPVIERFAGADTVVEEAKFAHPHGVVDGATVDHDRLPHPFAQLFEIKAAERAPLGGNHQCICPLSGVFG